MTEDYDYENYNSIYSKVIDEKLNRSKDKDIVDQLLIAIDELKKKKDKLEPRQFYGRILFNRRLPYKTFRDLYENNKSFVTSLKGEESKTTQTNSHGIMEYYVNIPEISGFLPEVNIEILQTWLRSKRKDKVEEAESQLKILSMYPRFYHFDNSLSESANGALIGQMAVVEYNPKTAFGSEKFAGKFIKLTTK